MKWGKNGIERLTTKEKILRPSGNAKAGYPVAGKAGKTR
jgi:hypothetical protein